MQILCPNCHAKTDNYRGRNTFKNSTPYQISRKNSKNHYCTCGKEFYSDRVRKFCSRECYNEDFKLKYDFHSLIVIQYDINGNKLREFPSLTDAAEFVGLSGTSGIAKCCKGKRRSAGGYLWRYKEL